MAKMKKLKNYVSIIQLDPVEAMMEYYGLFVYCFVFHLKFMIK